VSEEEQTQEQDFTDCEEEVQNRQVVHIILDNYHLLEQTDLVY
jgi:hypothetical protein